MSDPRIPEQVIADFAEQHGVSVPALVGRSHSPAIIRLRHLAVAEVKKRHPYLSTNKIGKLFDGRDHKTITKSLLQAEAISSGRKPPSDRSMAKEDRLEAARRWRGATLRLSDVTRIAKDETNWREFMEKASAAHLADLAVGGYETEDSTELQDARQGIPTAQVTRFTPIELQLLWSDPQQAELCRVRVAPLLTSRVAA